MSFTPFTVLWILLAVVVLALIAYRKIVSSQEEEALHLENAGEVAHQTQIAHKLDVIDKWGKLLTVIAMVYGLLLAGVYTFHVWFEASTRGGL